MTLMMFRNPVFDAAIAHYDVRGMFAQTRERLLAADGSAIFTVLEFAPCARSSVG